MTPTKYNQLNELLAEYSDLSADLAAIESDVNKSSLQAARPMLPKHAETKARIAEIEAKLKAIAVENPELFPDDKKTHQTPFGSVSFRTSSSIKIDDEEKAVLKIKEACRKELDRAARANRLPAFTFEKLIRTHEAPNIEALELFSDEALKEIFGIDRQHDEKFSVKPFEVKADKLAKKADKLQEVA